jgi:hypothetical protein
MKTKPKELKDITTAKIYADDEVLKNAPRHTHIGELEFFTLDRYVTDDGLEKEYESRGLEPADLYSLARWDEGNKDREDKKFVATHWKDAQGKWCFAVFFRWDGERRVGVYRSGRDWDGAWFFSGVRKSPQKSEAKTLASDPLNLVLPPELIINGQLYRRV